MLCTVSILKYHTYSVLGLHSWYDFMPNLVAFKAMYILKDNLSMESKMPYGNIWIWQVQLLKSGSGVELQCKF